MHVHSVDDWINLSARISELTFQNETLFRHDENNLVANGRKGYCVPNFLLKESNKVQFTDDQSTCFGDLTSFASIPCVNSTALIDGDVKDSHSNRKEGIYCLNVNDVIKLNKCANGWDKAITNDSTSICMCSEVSTQSLVINIYFCKLSFFKPGYLDNCTYALGLAYHFKLKSTG